MPTSELMAGLYPGLDAPVALTGATSLDGRQLGLAAAAVAARMAKQPGATWAVHAESPFVQIATLIALQSQRRNAVLLPHVQAQFLRRVRDSLDGLLVESTAPAEGAVELPPVDVLIEQGKLGAPLFCRWRQPIGFLTSGSSGEPTCVWRDPEQFISEIATIEAAFAGTIGRQEIFCGTTSHQHLYGFTFRVLWPFLTGRQFSNGQIRIPSDVAAAVRCHGRIVLISSPAFLSRASRMFDFEQLATSRFTGFSSGGPLDSNTALRFNRTPGVTLIEIYGSTETGALAQRCTRDDPSTPWRPLPGVQVEIVEGRVAARGRHFNGNRTLTTADLGESAPGGTFVLKGRADQIVKVADKRVSLSELERLLLTAAAVAEARVLQLQDGSLAAVISPSAEGWADVRRSGKRRFVGRLRDHLAQHADRVTTPRRWRLVKAIPRNAQGKVELVVLRELFAAAAANLSWQELRAEEAELVVRTTIPADLPELEGHFPGEPIVPGVVQIHWAATAALRHFDIAPLSGEMDHVKFRRPITPGCVVTMSLRLDRVAGRITFELGHDQVYSSGCLRFERR